MTPLIQCRLLSSKSSILSSYSYSGDLLLLSSLPLFRSSSPNYFVSILIRFPNLAHYHSDDFNHRLFLNYVSQQSKCGFRNVEHPISLFHQMDSLRPRPHIVAYTQLLSAMCKIKPFPPFATVISLFRYLERSGVRPDDYSLSILAYCYCRVGRADLAFSVLVKLCKLGFHPNIVIYNVLLVEYCLRGQMKEAENLINFMAENECKPDVVTINSLINGYCKHKRVDKALSLLQEMPAKGIEPDVVTYTTLVDALCKHKRLESARHLFSEMEARGVKPNVVTWNTLLDGLFKCGLFREANTTLREMMSNGVVPDIVTYRCIIDGLCEAGQLEEATTIYSSLLAKGCLQPEERFYNILIKGFCKNGLLTDAFDLFLKMKGNGCSPNGCTYNTIIRGFLHGKDVKKALELVSIMTSEGFQADAHTTSLLAGLRTDRRGSDKDTALVKKFFKN